MDMHLCPHALRHCSHAWWQAAGQGKEAEVTCTSPKGWDWPWGQPCTEADTSKGPRGTARLRLRVGMES